MIRAAIGVVPRAEAMRAAGFDPAADVTMEMMRSIAHHAMHMTTPGAWECHVRVYLTGSRWQWEAALREAGAEPESIEALVRSWEPGVPTAIVVADIPDAGQAMAAMAQQKARLN